MPISEFSIWAIAKFFFLTGLAVYVIFAGVVVRQIYLMTQTLSVGAEAVIKIAGWVHLALSLAVFIFAIWFL